MSEEKSFETRPVFEPLSIMGYFWLALGIIVLIGTFFVESNNYVPLSRGIGTNLVAGLVLVLFGLFGIFKGRVKKEK